MDEEKLVSALKAIGKECFISYLDYFTNWQLSNEEIASVIQQERSYTLNSCRSRTSKARSILKNDRLRDALQIIISSDRTDYQCRSKAKKILNDLKYYKPKTTIRRIVANTLAPNSSTTNYPKKNSPSNSQRIYFPDLSSTVEKELTIMLGKICHHIHPEIVNYITQKNVAFKTAFESFCHKSLNVKPFFYENSDCVFPGFRRPINKEKKGSWKNNVCENDGTILNDNTFPRHIWAYLSDNKAYSGGSTGMWTSSGLAKFELAHIFSHKQDEQGLEKKVFQLVSENVEPYGLFTSASNVILIPKGFAKPTDKMESVRICFYKRHLELYGNNLIGISNFNEPLLPSWYSEINWLEPSLPDDWKSRIDNLLNYRERYLQKKYQNIT
jgi:hypothetical protein